MQGTSVGTPSALSAGGTDHPKKFRFDSDKFRELVVYVAKHSDGDPRFGAVKLNKILYYSDFAAYRQLGQPITGATYRKYFEGPAPIELPETRKELIDAGDATSEERPYFAGSVVKLILRAGREPNIELFMTGELEIVDEVVDFFEAKTEREVAAFSNREPGCAVAGDREIIPYETAWLSSDPVSRDAEEWGIQLFESLQTDYVTSHEQRDLKSLK